MNSVKLVTIPYALAAFSGLSAQSDVTSVVNDNPIIKCKYTADPGAMVHDGKVCIYARHNECPPSKEHCQLNGWCVSSSLDMKTWTEHPISSKAKDFSWAKGEAWASQVIKRDGKFYWYVTVKHDTIHGKSIGVAASDSPIGPFVDARGSALIANDMTIELTKVSWGDINPIAFIDNDGQAYLYWGNTQCYYVKLKKNMIGLDGPVVLVHLPRRTEVPWIHKCGDWYCLLYASEFLEKIYYTMSRSITGPWGYKGIPNEVTGNPSISHQTIIEFKGGWYFVYHDGSINIAGGSLRRSVCIDCLYYSKDGTMRHIQVIAEGVQ